MEIKMHFFSVNILKFKILLHCRRPSIIFTGPFKMHALEFIFIFIFFLFD